MSETELDEQQGVIEAISQNVIPPQTIGHGRAVDSGRACPDRFCGCRFRFDGERARRVALEADVR
jgi:hypothetical protein